MSHQISASSPLLTVLKKNVDELDDILKPQFLDDFADASEDVLKKIQDGNLFDIWKNNIRTNNVEVLKDFALRGNVRAQYAEALKRFIAEEIKLMKQFEQLSDSEKFQKVAKGMFELRLKTATQFKLEKTPSDLLEWIHKFNVKRYSPIGGNKWGHTWESIIRHHKSKGLSGDDLYKKIIETSKTALADGDKLGLGDALWKSMKDEANSELKGCTEEI